MSSARAYISSYISSYTRLYTRFFILCLLLLTFMLALSACGSKPSPANGNDSSNNQPSFGPLARADPGYISYLEKLSMLGQSVDMARIVSGSNLSWRSPASPPDPDGLLRLADAWLNVQPYSLLVQGNKGAFSELASPQLWSAMSTAGIKGVFIAPTNTAGSVWAYDYTKSTTGQDIIQYSFSDTAGKESDYSRMLGQANKSNAVVGLDMAPAATGLGPDFFLAARWHRNYSGIYCMVEIDKPNWGLLPEVENQWQGKALSTKEISSLFEKGILPLSLAQDAQTTGADRGWAVTGQINGIDGTSRRWAYRYYYSPDRPVLNWEDPSATAKRILSGSAVREVGMLGGALLGLNLEPFQGLEPGMPAAGYSSEPALSAATSIGREVRRYGGWTFLRDELPLTHIAAFASDGPDFIYDSALSPATEHALLTGDATLLRYMLDEVLRLNINFKHLVHSTSTNEGISYALPQLLDAANRPEDNETINGKKAATFRAHIINQLKDKAGDDDDKVQFKNEKLITTSAGLALLALDIKNHDNMSAETQAEARKGLYLMNFFKAMQPGIFMVSGQDLVGTLPLDWRSMVDRLEEWDSSYATRGAYGLLRNSGSLLVTKQGMAKAKTLDSSLDEQVYLPNSLVSKLGVALKARTRIGLPRATFIGRVLTKATGSIAVLHKLPEAGDYLLTVANFGRSRTDESLNLAPFAQLTGNIKKVENLLDNNKNPSLNGQRLDLSLGAWEGMAILIKAKN